MGLQGSFWMTVQSRLLPNKKPGEVSLLASFLSAVALVLDAESNDEVDWLVVEHGARGPSLASSTVDAIINL